jgi:hypothetical protein
MELPIISFQERYYPNKIIMNDGGHLYSIKGDSSNTWLIHDADFQIIFENFVVDNQHYSKAYRYKLVNNKYIFKEID